MEQQTKRGVLKAYSALDGLIESWHYYSEEGRRNKMIEMEEDYAGMISYFQIFPYALEKEITKVQRRQYIRVPVEVKNVHERPKSEYSNNKSLYP